MLGDLFNCDFSFSKTLPLITSCSAVLRVMSCHVTGLILVLTIMLKFRFLFRRPNEGTYQLHDFFSM